MSNSNYQISVAIKFKTRFESYEEGVEKQLPGDDREKWEQLAQTFPGITLKPLYITPPDTPEEYQVTVEDIETLVEEGKKRDERFNPPDLLTFFVIEVPLSLDDPAKAAETLRTSLLTFASVEFAYVKWGPVPPPGTVNATSTTHFLNQVYLNAGPDGVNAKHAWDFLGGDGAGVQFMDLEQGWKLDHPDLPPGISPVWGVNKQEYVHGTNTLGVVVAIDSNDIGCVGIAPHASALVISEWPPFNSNSRHTELAIIFAGRHLLNPGDVLLLETQFQPENGSKKYLPIEYDPAVFVAIRTITANGIVVIEPAGNDSRGAGNDPGTFLSIQQDSRAIIVGGASNDMPHERLIFTSTPICGSAPLQVTSASNYGDRVDCYAWGECVTTTNTDTTGTVADYINIFNGTSSAAAIIAGVAVVVQGIAKANSPNNTPLSPPDLREILSDPNNGTTVSQNATPSQPPAANRSMPDLKKIIKNVLSNAALAP